MEDLERRLVSWATGRRDVRTVLVVGSRACVDHPADEWSDLDVAFTTTSPARYLETMDWLNEIGEVWVAFADPQGVTRHVLFAGGLDAGIAPLPHAALRVLPYVLKLRARFPSMFRLLPRPVRGAVDRQVDEISAYCRRGVRLLLDKDGLGASALARCRTVRSPVAALRRAVPRRSERVLVPDGLEREAPSARRALGRQERRPATAG